MMRPSSQAACFAFALAAISLALPAADDSFFFNGHLIEANSNAPLPAPGPDSPPSGLLVIRLSRAPEPQDAARLAAQGFEVLGFLPPDGFLVYAADGSKGARERRDGLSDSDSANPARWIRSLSPGWKTDTTLLERACLLAPGDETGVLIRAVADSDALRNALVAAGAMLTSFSADPALVNGALGANPANPNSRRGVRIGVRIAAERLADLIEAAAAQPGVYSIEPASGARLMNDNAVPILQTGRSNLGRPIWERGLRGDGQVIAVLDTGLDYDSCYFRESDSSAPPLVRGTDPYVTPTLRRKVIAYNFLLVADYPAGPYQFDSQGHGTAVAGNARGSRIDSPFTWDVYNGFAPAARLIVQDGGYGVDPCADLPALGCPLIDLTPVLEQAIAQGANIHNNSWGDGEDLPPYNRYTAPTADMDDAVWRHPQFLIVCAAGNSGAQGNDTVMSPSVGKNVLSIGATQSPTGSGSAESRATYSSRGYASDGRIKPDLMAPGITLTAHGDRNVTTRNCTTALLQGTSIASPLACASAAIVRQYFTEGWHPAGRRVAQNGFTPSAALIKAVLIGGAMDMAGVPGPPPNRDEGWGRIQLDNTLYFEGAARRLFVLSRDKQFTAAGEKPYSYYLRALSNSEGGLIKIVLVWTDPPAAAGASTALVNDLDLSVLRLGDETLFRGNRFNSGFGDPGYSLPGGDPDRLNNVEVVVFAPDTDAVLRVDVEAARIVTGPQPFALIATGAIEMYDADLWIVK